MAKGVVGTNAFTGLDVSKGKHLIAESSLVRAENTWTDEEGVIRVANGQDRLYSGYSAISCFAAGRQGGVDKLAWMDGDNVYVNGVNKGTINAGSDMYARDFDDNFYFMGSDDDKNFIYDGELLRQHGCWQADNMISSISLTIITPINITGMNLGVTTEILFTGSLDAAADQYIWITGITAGPLELNDRGFKVTIAAAGSYTINEDTSGSTAWSAGGTVSGPAISVVGDYKYYAVPTLKIVSTGVVLFGKPRGLSQSYSDLGPEDSWDADTVTFIGTNEAIVKFKIDYDYTSSGSKTTDYLPGVRLYRTKANGADIYLEKEWWHGDSDFELLLIGSTYTYANYDFGKIYQYEAGGPDTSLGPVYLPGINAHDAPPSASHMALVGQRLFMNDVNNPKRLYFTGLDGVDYVGTLDFLLIPDVITGIGSVGSVCVVFSCDRMWRVSMLGGIPDMDEIETDVGTTYGQIMATTQHGLFFLRQDGLWLTSGSTPPIKVGREGFSKINEPTTITTYGDVLYVGDKNTAYVMIDRQSGQYWHEHVAINTRADATNSKFYAANATSVHELFAGDKISATVTTKDFANPQERQAVRVVLDYEGDNIPSVWVNGNRESDYNGHPDEGTDREGARRMLRFSIPRLNNHVLSITITMSGEAALYGAWLETE